LKIKHNGLKSIPIERRKEPRTTVNNIKIKIRGIMPTPNLRLIKGGN